ncbi:MAG TPA: YdhK family protein [Planococcus sp. (in: firmicutes)]|nr:YdhK family protein [Planococcus sp. (in: firmicutes)]
MIRNKFLLGTAAVLVSVTLAACGETEDHSEMDAGSDAEQVEMDDDMEEMDEDTDDAHAGMDHSSDGEVPEGLEEASDPTYAVGDQAMMEADHMPGMDGAEATISGAFDTVAYSVTYTPTTGGDPVVDHKWVIHEELEDPGEAPLSEGDEVVLATDHMEGMEGAEAEIVSAEDTTVYMVDFTTADTGEAVVNHKWVTESELSPAE